LIRDCLGGGCDKVAVVQVDQGVDTGLANTSLVQVEAYAGGVVPYCDTAVLHADCDELIVGGDPGKGGEVEVEVVEMGLVEEGVERGWFLADECE